MSAAALTREALPEEDQPGGASAHPYAGKPLSAFQSITCICNDCGHAAVLDRDRLLGMSAVPSFGALWRHAYCAECRAVGSTKRNVTLHGLPIVTTRALKPQWSDAEIFGEKRSTPFPNLPRSRLMRDPGIEPTTGG